MTEFGDMFSQYSDCVKETAERDGVELCWLALPELVKNPAAQTAVGLEHDAVFTKAANALGPDFMATLRRLEADGRRQVVAKPRRRRDIA
jgi:hypothetical protein